MKPLRERKGFGPPEAFERPWVYAPGIDGPGLYYSMAVINQEREQGHPIDSVALYHEILEAVFDEEDAVDKFSCFLVDSGGHCNLRIVEETLRFALKVSRDSFENNWKCLERSMENVIKNALQRRYPVDLLQEYRERHMEIYNRLKPEEPGSQSSSAGVADVESDIQDNGYNVIGGAEDKELSERLTYLTGLPALAHHAEVYSPLRDAGQHEEISIEFASAATDQIKEAAGRLKAQGKDKIRILVIGSVTGIDALTAFHHAKFVNRFKSVEVDAIDIQEEGVTNTRFNFMLRLPGSRFEGETLQFAEEGLENDSIVVKRVIEGEEFKELKGKYDLILFHAPDAVGPRQASDTRVHMNQFVFKAILENARERLSDDGVFLLKNQRSILNAYPGEGRRERLIPAGFDVSFAGQEISLWAILAPPMPTSWAIFKLTLQPGLPKSGSLKHSAEIKRSLAAEKAISQSA